MSSQYFSSLNILEIENDRYKCHSHTISVFVVFTFLFANYSSYGISSCCQLHDLCLHSLLVFPLSKSRQQFKTTRAYMQLQYLSLRHVSVNRYVAVVILLPRNSFSELVTLMILSAIPQFTRDLDIWAGSVEKTFKCSYTTVDNCRHDLSDGLQIHGMAVTMCNVLDNTPSKLIQGRPSLN
ncbi:Hypothetical_protein [Hexamita inflata]|uniref:Hypothetical_protein n=1 Tax=Hexamita inflata TaxID=28002 RepID=A0AA86UT81_9EUKA|nr:Hypothetical protein HINF_LOCUS51406 [Hexamita inflata]CAI9963763.1 Hypothetical protein HINF_LOCUS51408 [Hexamita inflata]